MTALEEARQEIFKWWLQQWIEETIRADLERRLRDPKALFRIVNV